MNACQSGNKYRQWKRTGAYEWRNVATGRCLDSNTSKSVYTRPCNGGSFQKWDI